MKHPLSFKPSWGFTLKAIIALMVFAIAIAFSNLFINTSSMFHVSTYVMSSLLGKYFCYALLAIALNMVWGYCGILSLGHAAFFSLGSYAMGMYLTRQIGARGVYGDSVLPDFMVFLNWKELPWFWFGFDHFGYAAIMIILVPAILAFVFGWLAFRSRVTGVYFSIITQALTYALMLAFYRNDMGFGGNNGLNDFKEICGFPIHSDQTRAVLFVLTVLFVCLGLAAVYYMVQSRMGKVLIGVRDAESRTRFLGYRVENYKLAVWTFSAILAGIAGALYVPQVGIVNPSEFSPSQSIEVVIWVAVGGRGTLFGPVFGALLVNFGKTWFTSVMPEFWLFALGALFIIVTLYLPKGLIGLFTTLLNKLYNKKINFSHLDPDQRMVTSKGEKK